MVQEGQAEILIISYDQLKIHCKDVAKVFNIGKNDIQLNHSDLVVCDEGHRLKNAEIKTAQAVKMIATKKRVILSGTPIQNDLMEFFAMIDYVNPGILGDLATFKKTYEEPILRSRTPDATPEERELGRLRSRTLTEMTSRFILRRTSTINSKYLPPKMEYNVFCRLSPLQVNIYEELCKAFTERLKTDSIQALPLITALKKLCNTPALIHQMAFAEKQSNAVPLERVRDMFPSGFNPKEFQPEYSGKMAFLDGLLRLIKVRGDKIVIVSNYTETLAVLSTMCKVRGYGVIRLDGRYSFRFFWLIS